MPERPSKMDAKTFLTQHTWEYQELRVATVHGVALFNTGRYHPSHDCFEAAWYNFGAGSAESAFLHGMAQVAAGMHKLTAHENSAGFVSLWKTARTYLQPHPSTYYGVDMDDLRQLLTAGVSNPDPISSPQLMLDGDVPIADESTARYLNQVAETG